MPRNQSPVHNSIDALTENPGDRLTPVLFGKLYDAFFPRIYNYFSYRTTVREEAEDLTAQVFEKVITHYGQFDYKRGSFEKWLFAIARNLLLSQLRYQNRHPQAELDEFLEDDSSVNPSDQVLRQEELGRLRDYIARLSERDRELLALRFGANLSHRRIAELLEITENNVGVALNRALKRLRRLFESDEL